MLHSAIPQDALDKLKNFAYATLHPELLGPAFSLLGKKVIVVRRRLLAQAAAWLLIAQGEGASLSNTFGVQPHRSFLIRNGVPDSFFESPSSHNGRRGVLMVGRIEARKNQLGVITALRHTGIPITLVGAMNPFHRRYCALVMKEVRANGLIEYLPAVAHTEMKAVYERHAVHVNASWLEVAPLVDLEAAARGCAVVASSAGYTKEYLEECALYVDPADGPDKLRETILRALDQSSALSAASSKVVRQYTWSGAARQLAHAYRAVLESRSQLAVGA
jgi:glycosyltransferase involved in cell wall biosynthesis